MGWGGEGVCKTVLCVVLESKSIFNLDVLRGSANTPQVSTQSKCRFVFNFYDEALKLWQPRQHNAARVMGEWR